MTTVPGIEYVVTTSSTCTVTDDATGKVLVTAYAGQQAVFQAISESVTLSDPDAVVKARRCPFESAPGEALSLTGGSELPAGYTRLVFLESTGSQYIDTGLTANQDTTFKVDCEINANSGVSSGAVFGAQNGNVYQDRAGWSEFTAGTHGWLFWGWTSEDTLLPTPPTQRHRVELSQAGLYYNGIQLRNFSGSGDFQTSGTCWLFARNRPDTTVIKYYGRIYSFSFAQDGATVLALAPCVNADGETGMVNLVNKAFLKNVGSGQFVAGVATVAQLTALLNRLPSTGGALSLSLPAEANTPEVADMLQACHDSKGWTLTVHEYRPAAASTYSLRRVREVVWCRRATVANGPFVDGTGKRWQIDRCSAIFGRLGNDPTAYGYTPFDSVDEAAAHWELTPFVDPSAELETELETEPKTEPEL